VILKVILELHRRGISLGDGSARSRGSPGRGSGRRSPPEAETHCHLL